MRSKRNAAGDSSVGLDRRQRAASVTDVETPPDAVVAHVVRVVAERNRSERVKICRIDQLSTGALSVRYRNGVRVGDVGDALRLMKSWELFQVRRGPRVEHLDTVVPKRGDEETLPVRVE